MWRQEPGARSPPCGPSPLSSSAASCTAQAQDRGGTRLSSAGTQAREDLAARRCSQLGANRCPLKIHTLGSQFLWMPWRQGAYGGS